MEGKKGPRLDVNIVPNWLLAKAMAVPPPLPQHLALTEQDLAVFW